MEKEAIEVVTDAFIVIVGVAVERFLTDFPLGNNDPAFQQEHSFGLRFKWRGPKKDLFYWWCYVLALIILVTLVIRFLVGSRVDLLIAYTGTCPLSVRKFISDVSFLMFFAAFIVGAALSERIRDFMGWLSFCAATGVLWSVMAFKLRPPQLCAPAPAVSPWQDLFFLAAFAAPMLAVQWCKSVVWHLCLLGISFGAALLWALAGPGWLTCMGLQGSNWPPLGCAALVAVFAWGLRRVSIMRVRGCEANGASELVCLFHVVLLAVYVIAFFTTLGLTLGHFRRVLLGAEETNVTRWWLTVNSLQFMMCSSFYLCCGAVGLIANGGLKRERKLWARALFCNEGEAPDRAGTCSIGFLVMLLIMAALYMLLFYTDLKTILSLRPSGCG